MDHKPYDVRPTPANAGLTVRCTMNLQQLDKLPGSRKEKEVAALNQAQAEVVAKHLAKIADANKRDILTITDHGLPVIGPASVDQNTSLSLAHNFAMVLLDAKITALETRIAELESK